MKNKKIIISISCVVIVIILSIIYFSIFNTSNLIKLNYTELIEKINNKDDFVLCISASDCIHCQAYKPKLKNITKTYNIKIYYVNIDEFTDDEYQQFKIKFSFNGGTPTTVFFKEGEEKTTATRIEGNVSTDKIISKLKNNGFINE